VHIHTKSNGLQQPERAFPHNPIYDEKYTRGARTGYETTYAVEVTRHFRLVQLSGEINMDKNIISFLKEHAAITNPNMKCRPTPEMVKAFIEGKITEKEFLEPQSHCHKDCALYIRQGIKVKDLSVSLHMSTTHCFKRLAGTILESEYEDIPGTVFVATIPKKSD
jgi:hypothetical protein